MVVLNACDNLPQGMLETYSDVTLAIDIMYINKIPFMITTSREILIKYPQSSNLYNK